MNRPVLLAGLTMSLCFFGCPKATGGSDLGGGDNEQMDMLSAQLEEYHSQTGLECSQTCSLKGKVCAVTEKTCAIAARNADRSDHSKRCTDAQEECARFGEDCSRCKK